MSEHPEEGQRCNRQRAAQVFAQACQCCSRKQCRRRSRQPLSQQVWGMACEGCRHEAGHVWVCGEGVSGYISSGAGQVRPWSRSLNPLCLQALSGDALVNEVCDSGDCVVCQILGL